MANRAFRVPNISCGHCVKTIEREVGELPGVERVRAEESSRMVEINWDDSSLSWEEIKALLEEINYLPEE